MNFIRRLTRSTSSSQEKPQEPDLPLNCNIFGSSLKFSVLLTFREDNISSPRLIRDCIMYINEHGLDYPGIYRESGSYSKIEQLKNAYNEDPFTRADNITSNINDFCSLLKLYLRSLPSPLLSPSINLIINESLSCIGDREEGIVKILRYYLLCLPHCSYCTLGWVIRHLSLVYNKSKVNSMSLNNLIIIFSPCLNIQPLILSKLIVFADYLFVEDELGPKLDKNQIFELRYKILSSTDMLKYLRNEMSDTVEAKKAFANLFSKGSVYKMNPYLNNLSGEIENSILSIRSQIVKQEMLNLKSKSMDTVGPKIDAITNIKTKKFPKSLSTTSVDKNKCSNHARIGLNKIRSVYADLASNSVKSFTYIKRKVKSLNFIGWYHRKKQ